MHNLISIYMYFEVNTQDKDRGNTLILLTL